MRTGFLILLFGLLIGSPALAAEVVLIANRDNPQKTLNRNDAKNIFLGKKSTWDAGGSIEVTVQEDNQVHAIFTTTLLGRSPQQFSTYWKKALFTGTGTPPVVLSSDAEMKRFVAGNRGAIGYIDRSSLDSSVKVLELH